MLQNASLKRGKGRPPFTGGESRIYTEEKARLVIFMRLKVSRQLFPHVMRRPCWCIKQSQNVAQVLHNNIIKIPIDLFRYSSVHQDGRRDVTWKPRIFNLAQLSFEPNKRTHFVDTVIVFLSRLKLNCWIPCHWFAFYWIRTVSIVF